MISIGDSRFITMVLGIIADSDNLSKYLCLLIILLLLLIIFFLTGYTFIVLTALVFDFLSINNLILLSVLLYFFLVFIPALCELTNNIINGDKVIHTVPKFIYQITIASITMSRLFISHWVLKLIYIYDPKIFLNNKHFVELLILDENLINYKHYDYTPLFHAINFSSNSLEILIKHSNLNIFCNGYSPLHKYLISQRPDIKILQLFIDHGANINIICPTASRKNAFIYFVESFNTNQEINFEIFKFFVDHGANYYRRDSTDHSVFELIKYANNAIQLYDYLFEHGLDINYGYHGQSNNILHEMPRKRIRLLKYLLGKGIDVDATDSNYNTPLHLFIYFNHDIEEIELLLKHKAAIHEQDYDGNTAFLLCSNLEQIKLMLQYGANINDQNYKGENILMKIIKYKNSRKIFEYLIEQGIDINLKDGLGLNILDYTCTNDAQDIAELLLDRGITITGKMTYKRKADQILATINNYALIKENRELKDKYKNLKNSIEYHPDGNKLIELHQSFYDKASK